MRLKAVIDTNVLVSAFWTGNRESPPFRIYHAIMTRCLTPIYSDGVIAEYINVLHRSKFAFTQEEVDTLIRIVQAFGEKVTPAEPTGETFPDPDDKVFYCTALAAQGDGAALVTGNARHYPPAPFVVTPAEFAARLP